MENYIKENNLIRLDSIVFRMSIFVMIASILMCYSVPFVALMHVVLAIVIGLIWFIYVGISALTLFILWTSETYREGNRKLLNIMQHLSDTKYIESLDKFINKFEILIIAIPLLFFGLDILFYIFSKYKNKKKLIGFFFMILIYAIAIFAYFVIRS